MSSQYGGALVAKLVEHSTADHMVPAWHRPWTNFSQQDKTWAEFTSLEVAVFMLSAHVSVKQNSLT